MSRTLHYPRVIYVQKNKEEVVSSLGFSSPKVTQNLKEVKFLFFVIF